MLWIALTESVISTGVPRLRLNRPRFALALSKYNHEEVLFTPILVAIVNRPESKPVTEKAALFNGLIW
jgi:hypothetical protein